MRKGIILVIGIAVLIAGFIIVSFIEYILYVQNLMPAWPATINVIGLAMIIIGVLIVLFTKSER